VVAARDSFFGDAVGVDHGAFYRRIIDELGYDPDDVCEIRVSESKIEVDRIDFEDPDWPVITARHLRLGHKPRSIRRSSALQPVPTTWYG
jgi:hypothetical protein